eukprot:863026-Prymnesium_polylepis.1
MLRFSPRYEDKDDLRLYVPGSLLHRKLVFNKPVKLYASAMNPGAQEAAEEMQSHFIKDISITTTPLRRPPARDRHMASLAVHKLASVATHVLRRQSAIRTSRDSRHTDAARATSTLVRATDSGRVDAEGSSGSSRRSFAARPSLMPVAGRSSLRAIGRGARKSRPAEAAAQGAESVVQARGAEQTESDATHFLIYLNRQTYQDRKGAAFAQEVRDARAAGLPIIMIHERDEAKQGCEFDVFFQTT